MREDLWSQPWFDYLDGGQKELVKQAYVQLDEEKAKTARKFHDYSFVVFPVAKAYEGFLKKYLYDLGIIGEGQYKNTHFRIGKSLNPDLPTRYRRNDWVVEELDKVCGHVEEGRWRDMKLSQVLWRRWKEGRNALFHYFPGERNLVSLGEAEELMADLVEAMQRAVECQAFLEGNKDTDMVE